MEEHLRILFVGAEVTPFARTGGLGDVLDVLPSVLAKHGCAVQAAVSAFADKAAWRQLQHNAMTQDFSWDQSAQQYLKLYRQMIGE